MFRFLWDCFHFFAIFLILFILTLILILSTSIFYDIYLPTHSRSSAKGYSISSGMMPAMVALSSSSLTSVIMWINTVERRTPPPKQSKTDVSVRFQTFSSFRKNFPIFKGRKPRIKETTMRSTIEMYFAVEASMISYWRVPTEKRIWLITKNL